MKHSTLKSLVRVTSKSQLAMSKVHHNKMFYKWVGIPNMLDSCMEWKCMLGKRIVRYHGFEGSW